MDISRHVMICHNCESDDIKFNAEQERYVCEECGCTQMNLPEPVNTTSIGDNNLREKYDLNDKPCVECGTMKPTCSLIKSSHLGGLACCDCVNALTIPMAEMLVGGEVTFSPSGIPQTTGFHQTLCADCKTPTPLNDMFPTGPNNIFKCWACAQIPVLADITD